MSWYYGSDTNNATPFPSCASAAPNFYIGKIGAGISQVTGYFDTTAANDAGYFQTFAYWDLEGPGSRGQYSPSAWGNAQAKAFVNAWNSGDYAGYLGGTTFFLDTESGNLGWAGQSQSQNQEVLAGALEYLSTASTILGQEAYPGIYISQSDWDTLFGSGFVPGNGFVLWLAGTNCPSCSQAQSDFGSKPSVGGYKTMIWQYAASPGCGNQDLDITPYEGYYLNHTWKPVVA